MGFYELDLVDQIDLDHLFHFSVFTLGQAQWLDDTERQGLYQPHSDLAVGHG